MEFGALIPLFYMSMCCIVLVPIIGIALLLYFKFSLKDVQLTKNVTITVVSTSLIGALYLPVTSIWGLLRYSQCCAESGRQSEFWDLLINALPNILSGSLWFAFLGSGLGFIISYILVTPITILIRGIKQKNSPSYASDSQTITQEESEATDEEIR